MQPATAAAAQKTEVAEQTGAVMGEERLGDDVGERGKASAPDIDEVVVGTPDAVVGEHVAASHRTGPARGNVRDLRVRDDVISHDVARGGVAAVAGKQDAP